MNSDQPNAIIISILIKLDVSNSNVALYSGSNQSIELHIRNYAEIRMNIRAPTHTTPSLYTR